MTELIERPVGTPPDAPPHPGWDHATWPYAPREGIQAPGNKHYLTAGLFLETAREGTYDRVRYVLDDHDIYASGPGRDRWIPSARLIFIHAVDEYDAARKLVGNLTHWERLFDLEQFAAVIDEWRVEQRHIQRMAVRRILMERALAGGKDTVASARALLSMIDKAPVGRPKKAKPKADALGDVDHMRVVAAYGERV